MTPLGEVSELEWSGRLLEKAGKTQLALQLALSVQLPSVLGGLSGTTCYLTTSSTLSTTRLVQILDTHPLLSPSHCGLLGIHTIATPSISILNYVLSQVLPQFITDCASNFNVKPVKLLVIDALAELFHSADKTSAVTLIQRSKHLTEISTILHTLASRYQIAILVLNEVIDVFDRGPTTDNGDTNDLMYRDQSKWFNRAHSIPGEDRKEASLGLVWANQVNVRIMLTRTSRRRHSDEVEIRAVQRRRVGKLSPSGSQSVPLENDTVLIRRLSVIFSPVSHPISLDYIVTEAGITAFSHHIRYPRLSLPPLTAPHAIDERPTTRASTAVNIGYALDAENEKDVEGPTEPGPADTDEWETYWKTDDTFNDVDLDSLESIIN